jgi:hypothetical protein
MLFHELVRLLLTPGQGGTSHLLYIGPDQIMPLTSWLAGVLGVLLIFWRYVMGLARRFWQFVRRK